MNLIFKKYLEALIAYIHLAMVVYQKPPLGCFGGFLFRQGLTLCSPGC